METENNPKKSKFYFSKILFVQNFIFPKIDVWDFFFSREVWHVTPRFECHDAWKQKIPTKINFLKI